MTYREKFRSSTDWKQRVLTMELFHFLMIIKHKSWHMKDTAKYFGVSLALVSENLKLAKALENHVIDSCTSRVKALQLLRKNK